VAKFL